VLSNWKSEAVLDRETGLVWQREPATLLHAQSVQRLGCQSNATGDRYGWRLPTQVELMTLGDPTNVNDEFHLPGGHPFIVAVADGTEFWSSDNRPDDPTVADAVNFRRINRDSSIAPGITQFEGPSTFFFRAWCVRGPS